MHARVHVYSKFMRAHMHMIHAYRAFITVICHTLMHAYVTYIMDECRDILIDETRLSYGYTFFIEDDQNNHY